MRLPRAAVIERTAGVCASVRPSERSVRARKEKNERVQSAGGTPRMSAVSSPR